MTPKNENEERTTVIGKVTAEKDTLTQVSVVTSQNETKQVWIPHVCVAHKDEVDGESIFFLRDAEMQGRNLAVAQVFGAFANHTDHAELRDMADAWNEFGELPTVADDAEEQPDDDAGAFDEDDADAFEDNADAFEDDAGAFDSDDDVDAFDDEVPQFTGGTLELSLSDDDKAETKEAARKMSAAKKAALAREARFAEAKEIKDNLNTSFAKALADGKRHQDFGAWNFDAVVVEMAQAVTDPITGETTYHIPRNPDTGEALVRQILNPTITDEFNPNGVTLNRAIGQAFEHIDHPTLFMPVIEEIDKVNAEAGREVISWDAFSINQGKRAVFQMDITDFATKTRKEAAANLGNFGYVNLSANRISDALVEEQGGHRVGITIINAHDGKSALQSFMSVMRTYCGNLAMRGGVQNLLMAGNRSKLRHTKGVMSEFNAGEFAERITSALAETQKNLLAMHILRYLPIEQNLFDKVLTVFDKAGLISAPTVKVEVGDLNQLAVGPNGKPQLTVADLGKDAVKMTGGHAYNAVLSGWVNPDLEYVAMGKDNGSELDTKSHGTMFHAAQSLTGTITHNPVWSDGKRVLHGKTQGVETMMKRSSKATNLLEFMAFNAVETYSKHIGGEVDDLEAMSAWFAENPDKLQVPVSSHKATGGDWNPKTVPLTEVQDYAATWKVNVMTA